MKLILLFTLFISTVLYAEGKFTNELIHEDSPYLQQHAHNPVQWYAWNKVSLTKAKKEQKPIFLSIGYSTCHWCHVMAHESFEDESIAKLINENFIAIKVDREELPHLDKYYQNIYLLLQQRSGGWPLSVFLTEDAKPFHIGAYIPPSENYNIEGLDTLLPRLANEYQTDKQKLLLRSLEIEQKMKRIDTQTLKPVKIELNITKKIFSGLQEQYDEVYHGFSIRPKFPESSKISLLFDLDALGVEGAKEMALEILREMALHGLYDQVEGGFFRYSVDAAWEIPHFEKMLYTNAELIPLYVKAYLLTKDRLYKNIVVETIGMIEEKFQKDNVYFSASDADSGHQEGGYFIYNYKELIGSMKKLDPVEKEELSEVLDISEIGNFEEQTHINFYAQKRPENFEKIKPFLKKIREKRKYPFIDEKINTAWNAMMIEALFSASVIDKRYKDLAEKRMDALLSMMYKKDVLYHQSLLGKAALQKALLEDYAFLISALICGYQMNYDERYFFLIKELSKKAVNRFYDGKYWYLSADGIKVYADLQDKYYSAAVSKTLLSLLKLASLSGEREYLDVVKKSIESKSALLYENPSWYASAMKVVLAEKLGYVTIKSATENLIKHKKDIHRIKYPFILSKPDKKIDGYLGCDMLCCFIMDKAIEQVISEIEKR